MSEISRTENNHAIYKLSAGGRKKYPTTTDWVSGWYWSIFGKLERGQPTEASNAALPSVPTCVRQL